MYVRQKVPEFHLARIRADDVVTIDAATLYVPSVGAPGGKEIRYLAEGIAPRTVVCFGPYIGLRGGSYVVQLHGEISGTFEIRLTEENGKNTLVSQMIQALDEAIFFHTPNGADNFEVVILTTGESSSFNLDRVDLFRMDEDQFSATKLLSPQLHEIMYLQNEPPATNSGYVKGRNLRAGYVRGTYIACGGAEAVMTDPDWIAAQKIAEGRSIANPNNLLNLFLILKYSEINGNIIEFGAFQGGTSLMMAALLKRMGSNRKVYALDTFEGMPDTCDATLDVHTSGGFAEANYDELVEIRDRHGLDNLVILKGLFQDTVGQIPTEERKFFLANVDCDIYDSVKFSINYAAEYAVDGAYFAFDDPLVFDCLGAFQAVEEDFIQNRGLYAEQAFPQLIYRFPVPSALR